jgi:cyclase
MHKTLIVARMNPADAPEVAKAFAESDAGELPGVLGVTERRLFAFHGLYFHLVETAEPLAGQMPGVRGSAAFSDINSRLSRFVTAYDPATWRGPADAMAAQFYSWSSAGGRGA